MSEPDNKNAAPEFDAYGHSYSDTVNQALAFSGLKVDFFTRVKAEYLIDLVDALHAPASSAEVIDIGCGVGNAHPLLLGRFAKLAGVDVSSACIATARERHPSVDYATYDGLNLPHGERSFDVAFAICVFHHVPVADRGELLTDIRRVLRPGGIFAIFEHNPRNPLTMRVVNNCEFDRNAVLLPYRESESLLRDAGFANVHTRHILTIPAVGRVLRSIDRMFSGLALGAQYYTAGRA